MLTPSRRRCRKGVLFHQDYVMDLKGFVLGGVLGDSSICFIYDSEVYYSHRDHQNCTFVTATACKLSTASRTAVACTCAIRRRLRRYNHVTRIRVVDSATRNAQGNTTPTRCYLFSTLHSHKTKTHVHNTLALYTSSSGPATHSFPQSHQPPPPMSRTGHLGFLPTTQYSLSPRRMTTTATTGATRVATCSSFLPNRRY